MYYLKTSSLEYIDSGLSVYMVEEELWSAVKNGDRHAFERMYRIFVDDLLRYGYRITKDRQLIRDSIQDLFLHIWTHRENLSDTTSVRFYLYRSLRNRIIKNMDQLIEKEVDTEKLYENILQEVSVEEKFIRTELDEAGNAKLRHAIDMLSKRQQEAIQLRYYHNFNLEEIAEIMQVTNQSVRNFIHRAILDLRKYFLHIDTEQSFDL
ncbi:MAG: RNA polymerase sigma factor [Leadbetterella sp.]